MSWEVVLNTTEESGFPAEPGSFASGDDFKVEGRTLCLLRLVKGSQDDARSVAWKKAQIHEPVAPPTPVRPTRHAPIDQTTAGFRYRAAKVKPPTTSELAQGTKPPEEPEVK